MEMQSSGMIGTKLAMEFLRGSSLKEDFLFALAHPNMRMLMANSPKFVRLLQCWSIRVDLKDCLTKLEIGQNDNFWVHLLKGLFSRSGARLRLVNPAL